MINSYKLKIKDKKQEIYCDWFYYNYIDKLISVVSYILQISIICFQVKIDIIVNLLFPINIVVKSDQNSSNIKQFNVNTNYQCYCNFYTDFIDTYPKHVIKW